MTYFPSLLLLCSSQMWRRGPLSAPRRTSLIPSMGGLAAALCVMLAVAAKTAMAWQECFISQEDSWSSDKHDSLPMQMRSDFSRHYTCKAARGTQRLNVSSDAPAATDAL